MRMIKMMYLLTGLFLVAVLLSNCTHIIAVKRAEERREKSSQDLKKAGKDLEEISERKKDLEIKITVNKEERDRLEREIKQLEESKITENGKMNKLRADLNQINDQIKKQEAEIDGLNLKIKKKKREEKEKRQLKDKLDEENE